MKRYAAEIEDFIRSNVQGRTAEELTALVNAKFGDIFTPSKMKAYKSNHKLKSGTRKGKPASDDTTLYPLAVREFIQKNYIGVGYNDMAQLLSSQFDRNYTAQQMKGYYGRFKLNSGLDGRFEKGHTSHNKGKKGFYAPGCEKSWFKKGETPINHKPVGSERIDSKDGYVFIKIKEPNVWALKHKLIWEQTHGKVPKRHVVTFLDGDKTNISIENLALISTAESLMLTRKKLRSTNADLTKSGILCARLSVAVHRKEKER